MRIKTKNSVTTTNTPASLLQGELAVNITDKKLWVGNASTTPIPLIGSTANVTYASVNAGNTFGFKNRLINGGFIINQRGYVSGTALSVGNYAHDRWKAGASGCTYTFTQPSAGVNATITITAGTLQQVIEGCNMPEGGTFTLSWTGTAQAKVNSGSYGTSPIIVTGLTAGSNATIEFATGTVNSPQFEVGLQATGFDYRFYTNEELLCQRYYVVQNYVSGGLNGSGTVGLSSYMPTTMRRTPNVSYVGTITFNANGVGTYTSTTQPTSINMLGNIINFYINGFGATAVAGFGASFVAPLLFDAEI